MATFSYIAYKIYVLIVKIMRKRINTMVVVMKFEKLLISLVIIISSIIIATGMRGIIHQDRSVTVRGLCEKEVDADMAIWPMTFNTGNNELSALQKDIISKTAIITAYLKEHNLDESDFTVQAPNITDNSVNPYVDRDRINYTYLAKETVLIRSSKIQEVINAQKDSLSLAGKGIAISQEYDSRINFDFTGLNAIKPEMIAAATKNARQAAEQFASDSNSKVGKIKRATQGLFSIENAAVGLEEKKIVRVVTTVEYSLK